MKEVKLNLSKLLGTQWLGLCCCGMVSACLGQAPPNDNFANAIPLHGNSVTFTGTLANATYEPGESQVVHRFFEGGSVWWSWKATNSSQVVISTVDPDGYGAFAVHSATNVTDITDDSQLDWNFLDIGYWVFRVYPMQNTPTNYVSFTATAGKTYYIRALGNTASSFALRLTATNSPVILGSPQDQIIRETGSAFFSVFAAGLRPLKYQWQFNGSNLAGQTGPCLELGHLTPNHAGGYAVVVSNASGVITSGVASLTVISLTNQVLLKALGLSGSNRFAFSITGETGQVFRVWGSTNVSNWPDEYEQDLLWVRNTNTTSVYSILMLYPRQFLRVSRYVHDPNLLICINRLQEIDFATKLWAVETKNDLNSVTETDITPYLTGGTIVCPSGGTTFADSYALDGTSPPVCLRVPFTHVVP